MSRSPAFSAAARLRPNRRRAERSFFSAAISDVVFTPKAPLPIAGRPLPAPTISPRLRIREARSMAATCAMSAS
jgi:hypothetical protein